MEAKKDGSGGPSPAGKTEAADPQLVEAATKFVSDVIEKAKEEAGRRRAQQKRDAGTKAGADGGSGAEGRKSRVTGGPIPWHSRARGLLSRLLSSFCFRGTPSSGRSEIPKSS